MTDKTKHIIIFILAFWVILFSVYVFTNRGATPRPVPGASTGGETNYEKVAVKNTLVRHASILQKCYLAYLDRKPKVEEGDVTLDWLIQADGEVDSANVISSPIEEEEMRRCLEDTVKGIKFPPAPDGIPHYISHQFVFQKEETFKKQQEERLRAEAALEPKPDQNKIRAYEEEQAKKNQKNPEKK